MRKSRFSEEQIIRILEEVQGGRLVKRSPESLVPLPAADAGPCGPGAAERLVVPPRRRVRGARSRVKASLRLCFAPALTRLRAPLGRRAGGAAGSGGSFFGAAGWWRGRGAGGGLAAGAGGCVEIGVAMGARGSPAGALCGGGRLRRCLLRRALPSACPRLAPTNSSRGNGRHLSSHLLRAPPSRRPPRRAPPPRRLRPPPLADLVSSPASSSLAACTVPRLPSHPARPSTRSRHRHPLDHPASLPPTIPPPRRTPRSRPPAPTLFPTSDARQRPIAFVDA